MTTETIVKVGDYEVSHTNGTHFVARRNGQLFRDITGDNLVLALVNRIDQLEKAFTQPTSAMVQAGLAEVQNILDGWSGDSIVYPDDVTDTMASDLAVFVFQVMASKLPKVGE
ncbi:hypothetical protein PP754_gp046 [Pectobacterium phage Possum]|uniref:Tail assembly chaperone n=1 Tax=Pectobacterium phage Possum TaxID=2686301 RepID=A0A7T0LWC6_9CAUD|nr:hypothetical protein PP754_gp046 [Pectobacterium phage Possum]QPL10887.1 hypothetical protein Possum_00046 [Pectobacterium phage Possum]QPL10989.1 hypothetical protein Horatius_00046 [Pectobacterium phage Horatius]